MNEPNTEPQPPPQPPKGRHPLAWLVFLLPCAISLLSLSDRGGDHFIGFLLLSVGLCFYLGHVAEKWRHKETYFAPRVLIWSFLIFLLNCLIFFAGCLVAISRLNNP